MRRQQDSGSRSLEGDAALGAQDRVTEVNPPTDAESRSGLLQSFDQGHGVEPLAVHGHRHALTKFHAQFASRSRLVERAAAQDPCGLRNATGRIQRFRAADGDAPKSTIDRIRRTGCRQREPPAAQVFDLVLPSPGVIPDRRKNFQFRRQGLEDDLEPHLVVAGGRASVSHGVRAEFPGRVGQATRLNAPLGADAQRVHLPPAHVAHEQVLEHLAEEIAAGFHELVIRGAQRCRPLGQGVGRRRIDTAGVDRHRDHRTPAGFLEPRHAERGVEPPGESQHDGLTAH